MKKDQFYKLLKNPSEASSVDIKSLKSQLSNTQYFSGARVLLAKALQERKSIDLESEIENSGIWYPNLLLLQNTEEEPASEPNSSNAKEGVAANEKFDVTKEIIEILPKSGGMGEPLHTKEVEEVVEEKKVEKNTETTVVKEEVLETPKEDTQETPVAIEVKETSLPSSSIAEEEIAEPEKEVSNKSETEKSEETNENIADQVMRQLEEMKSNRALLKEAVKRDDRKKNSPTKKATSAKAKVTSKGATTKSSQKKAATKVTTQKTKAQSTPKKAVKANPKTTPKKTSTPARKSAPFQKKKVATKEKAPETPKDNQEKKLKNQRKLIKEFITNPPEITPDTKAKEGPNPDLSENSTSENRLLVSESLAKILTRQGKKQKAIEVYNQLMLKYPKKKSYFAAQIKSLEG